MFFGVLDSPIDSPPTLVGALYLICRVCGTALIALSVSSGLLLLFLQFHVFLQNVFIFKTISNLSTSNCNSIDMNANIQQHEWLVG